MSVDNEQHNPTERNDRAPPDGGYGWVICFTGFITHFLVDGINSTFAIFLTDYQDHFQANVANISVANALRCALLTIQGPALGAMVKRYSSRTVTMAGLLLSTVSTITSTYVQTVATFHLTYGVLGGIGFGMAVIPPLIEISCYFNKKRALAMGIAMSGTGVGYLSLAPLARLLNDELGWKISHFVFAGLLVQGLVVGALMRPLKGDPKKIQSIPKIARAVKETQPCKSMGSTPYKPLSLSMDQITPGKEQKSFQRLYASEHILHQNIQCDSNLRNRADVYFCGSLYSIPEYKPKQYESNTATDVPMVSPHKKIWLVLKSAAFTLAELLDIRLLKNKSMVILSVAGLLAMYSYYVPLIFSTNRAIQHGVPEYEAAFLLSTYGICSIASRIVFGVVVSCLPKATPLLVLNISMTIGGLAVILTPLCTTFPAMMTAMAIYGLFYSTFITLQPLLICDLLGVERLSSAYGIILLVQSVATVAGPPLSGKLYDLTGNYDYGFYMAGGCILLSVVIYCLLHFKLFKE